MPRSSSNRWPAPADRPAADAARRPLAAHVGRARSGRAPTLTPFSSPISTPIICICGRCAAWEPRSSSSLRAARLATWRATASTGGGDGRGEDTVYPGRRHHGHPANHPARPLPGRPRTDCLGYVINGSRRVYFTGDTDLFAGMADIGLGLDVALLPVWGWGPTLGAGHLDPLSRAQALELLRPSLAIPIHWGRTFRWACGRFCPIWCASRPTPSPNSPTTWPRRGGARPGPGDALDLTGFISKWVKGKGAGQAAKVLSVHRSRCSPLVSPFCMGERGRDWAAMRGFR